MFQRGGSARSSLRSFHHRPLSVHSPMPTMDAPLPASVAALVCNYGSPPPVPGGTSRRSLMAEWRPHNLVQETRAKSRLHSSLTDVSRPEALNGYNSVFVEDDYADPFDTILPSSDKPNRSSGYFATLRQDQRRSNSRSGSPVTLRQGSSPMIVQRSDSPMSVQRNDSPLTVQRNSSPINFQQRSESPMSAQRFSDYNMNSYRCNSPVSANRERLSCSMSPKRQSAGSDIDPFYFTLEQRGSPADSPDDVVGPEDDYDEVEPQSPIESPNSGVLVAASAARELSSTSSNGSSSTSLSGNSPSHSSSRVTSPCDTEMYAALDHKTEKARPVPQRPLSCNVYESCGPRKPPLPVDDGIYSKLNRNPSQQSEQPASLQRGRRTGDLIDENPYGRLERSYSARNPVRTQDGPQGNQTQRNRSAMIKGPQGSRSTGCVAGEWVPAEPYPRQQLLQPRSAKSPLVTGPRKKFRFSLRGKKQLTKKSSTEEVDSAGSPTSAPTLTPPVNWRD